MNFSPIFVLLIVLPVAFLADAAGTPAASPQEVQAEAATDTEALIFRAADRFGVPRSLARAVVAQESGGNAGATSPVGAAGLMQIMPATAAGIAQELDYSSYDLYDPQTSATFGMYYLSQKLARYGVPFGLAAYNWGPAAVDAFLSRHPGVNWEAAVETGEIPAETQGYVRNILTMQAQLGETRAITVSLPKCLPTATGAISAHFSDTASAYWGAQYLGQHNGTDYSGQSGDPVFAPFGLTVEDIQYYSDPGRIGWYVQGRFSDGYLFYAGHLGTVAVQVGDTVGACAQIGTIGSVAHTHIKINRPGSPEPCEATGCDDFERYFNEH